MIGEGRRKYKKERLELGDMSDPTGLAASVQAHLKWMQTRNYSKYTVDQRLHHLRTFIGWCEVRSIRRPCPVDV